MMVQDMDDNEAIHKFIYGLKPHIKVQVQLIEPSTLGKAMQKSLQLDDIYAATRRGNLHRPIYYRSRGNHNSANSGYNTGGPLPMEVGMMR